jgi:protein NRD1
MSERELKDAFARYGHVQTCIVNHEKRHAFIKMLTRREALAAKEGMETGGMPDFQLRVRFEVFDVDLFFV